MFAGHSHKPTAHLVSGCPLCDTVKEARNRAIDHLSEALYLLAGIRADDDQATVRFNISPVGVSGDDVERCHSFDLSAKQAEGLCDAIDSINAYLASGPEHSSQSPASLFALQHPATAGLIADAFDEIFAEVDPKVFLGDVLTAADPEKSGLAYQSLLCADEDGDQA